MEAGSLWREMAVNQDLGDTAEDWKTGVLLKVARSKMETARNAAGCGGRARNEAFAGALELAKKLRARCAQGRAAACRPRSPAVNASRAQGSKTAFRL